MSTLHGVTKNVTIGNAIKTLKNNIKLYFFLNFIRFSPLKTQFTKLIFYFASILLITNKGLFVTYNKL